MDNIYKYARLKGFANGGPIAGALIAEFQKLSELEEDLRTKAVYAYRIGVVLSDGGLVPEKPGETCYEFVERPGVTRNFENPRETHQVKGAREAIKYLLESPNSLPECLEIPVDAGAFLSKEEETFLEIADEQSVERYVQALGREREAFATALVNPRLRNRLPASLRSDANQTLDFIPECLSLGRSDCGYRISIEEKERGITKFSGACAEAFRGYFARNYLEDVFLDIQKLVASRAGERELGHYLDGKIREISWGFQQAHPLQYSKSKGALGFSRQGV